MKVFGIGFHKTGTSSLGEALRILGVAPIANYTPELLQSIEAEDFETVREYCSGFQGFEDNPWPIIYQQMDKMFPGSKFVLTIRDSDAWIQSITKHFGSEQTEMRRWIYGAQHGAPVGSENIYRQRYDRHNEEVLDYFSDRPNDLAVLNWTEGASWQKLCDVLGMAVPQQPFPHTNRAEQRTLLGRLKTRFRTDIGK
ncbi:sulfotransferase family protein [Rhodopirellula bahusiensis]